MPTAPTAYAVMMVEAATGKMLGVGIFSEEGPTMSMRLLPVVLFAQTAEIYTDAATAVGHILDNTPWLQRDQRDPETTRRDSWVAR